MARERLAMKNIKEIFRLRYELKLSQREVARICECGKSTVQDYERRAINAGLLNFIQIEPLSIEELNGLLAYPKKPSAVETNEEKNKTPDWAKIRDELVRDKNVTLKLLWTEYKEVQPDGFQYTQFCEHYRRWKKHGSLSMRQEHRGGEKTFIDYAGAKMNVEDRETGEVRAANIFVGVLGASSYIYAEATWTQNISDWIGSHIRMFSFFGGATQILVPDNLRSGVAKSNRYEAKINSSYKECAEHYGTCVIPARVRKPKDKAKAEVSVQIVQRWIVAALRHKVFYSLQDLNDHILELIRGLNARKMRHLGRSRQELFEAHDKPFLLKLPSTSFEYGIWKLATVNIDYHISFEKNYYSVPSELVQKKVELRATEKVVEIFCNLKRVASHRRSYLENRFITNNEHRPAKHQAMNEWTPERMTDWALASGDKVAEFVKQMLERKVHPEQSYRSILGVLRLGEKHGKERLNKACERALGVQSLTYQTVKNILEKGMENVATKYNEEQLEMFADHENVRGSEYYH